MSQTAAERAQEAADVIESCALSGEELTAFLLAFISDLAADGDLDAIRAGRPAAQARLEKALNPTNGENTR